MDELEDGENTSVAHCWTKLDDEAPALNPSEMGFNVTKCLANKNH